MKAALFILLGWIVLLLQSTLVSFAAAGLPQPDFLLLLMIYVGYTIEPRVGMPLALLYGYLLDLFVGGIFGTHLLQYATLYLLCWALRGRLRMTSLLVQIGVVFTLTVVGALELRLAARLVQVSSDAVGPVGLGLLARAVTNAALGLLMFPLLARLDRRLWPRVGRLAVDLR